MSDEQPTEKLPGTYPSETHLGQSPQRLSPPLPFQQYPEQPRDPVSSQPTPLYSPPPSSPLRSPTPSSP
ncbi:MAG: hypothetical protein C5B60_00405, partial [Chloroflexi bacterium]